MTSPWPNFSYAELRCKCGRCGSDGTEMDPAFMDKLQQLRERFGQAMRLSSAYRCPAHPVEAKKAQPGEHCTGKAVDVAIQGAGALALLGLALELGFTRIGVQQKGGGRFLHLGTSAGGRFPSPAIWSY
ncbi:D-Ala-D-Ala carboxypeptidase family metallohydrolase [Stutzerimonas nitrititolerans]|uniref:D-Ala-D-Ala carboxypeptidase family metallohydrolase n=1 Tax=Stutzerimonas nitrititolerans TaxID=2482751 RepID=UPI00202963D9|nr:D-Ala-D-Ala carboxypeptidase family metallohydrolase [Stutzerimonas nitrititolerans]